MKNFDVAYEFTR